MSRMNEDLCDVRNGDGPRKMLKFSKISKTQISPKVMLH
jgi:hypothetical protein